MSTILHRIASRRVTDAERELTQPLPIRTAPFESGAFARAIAAPGLSVIAEIKRRSPSRGALAAIPDPVALARLYVEGGARAISVLTEPHEFGGLDSDLQAVAGAELAPALRKDFVTLPFQIHQAKALGASAVLLIAAILPRELLQPLLSTAHGLGLDALVEVHSREELELALACGARIVGVNHRNLHDFSMDMSLFATLRPLIPAGVLTVAESGIRTVDDAQRMLDAGADAILTGESVATAADPAALIRSFAGVS
jgi:indole-3-glycerol phosphate synthase